ncbi:MAG: glycosyltransferase family 39 protein [Pirellulales bacterium]
MKPSEYAAHDARRVAQAEDDDVALYARRRRETRTLVVVLLATVAVRVAVILARWDQFAADPDGYRLIAESLSNSGVYGRPLGGLDQGGPLFATAYRPPLYPLLLSAFVRHEQVPPAAVATLHVFLALAAVACVYRLGCNLGLRRAAACAALGVAVDPILLHQSTLIMTETVAAFFTAFLLLLAERLARRRTVRYAAALGLTLGAAALCRPTFLPLVPCFAAACFAFQASRWRRFGLAVVVLSAALLAVSPWALRNHRVFHRWIVTTTHGGYTLLLGNNPDFYAHLVSAPRGEPWLLPSDDHLMQQCRAAHPELSARRAAATGPEQELLDDQLAYECAREHIRARPDLFARACLYRAAQFWSPLPHATSKAESRAGRAARWSIGAWYVALYATLTIAAARHRLALVRWPWLSLALVALCFAAAHVTYWSNLRMRGPVMPALYLLASTALAPSLASLPAAVDPPRGSRGRPRRRKT